MSNISELETLKNKENDLQEKTKQNDIEKNNLVRDLKEKVQYLHLSFLDFVCSIGNIYIYGGLQA